MKLINIGKHREHEMWFNATYFINVSLRYKKLPFKNNATFTGISIAVNSPFTIFGKVTNPKTFKEYIVYGHKVLGILIRCNPYTRKLSFNKFIQFYSKTLVTTTNFEIIKL